MHAVTGVTAIKPQETAYTPGKATVRNESVSLQQFVKSTMLTFLLGLPVRFTVILNTEREQCLFMPI
jgi:hypothetical protein